MEEKRKSVTKNPLSGGGGAGPSGAGAAAAAPAQQAMGRGQQHPAAAASPADFGDRVRPVDRDQLVMLVRRPGGRGPPSSRGVLLPLRAPFKPLRDHSGVVHFVATPHAARLGQSWQSSPPYK